MKICGLTSLTLLDFPGHIACTVFLGGCNFRCPYCHNAGIAFGGDAEEIPETEVLKFLKKRQGILDGVCISGGEPLINDGVIDFMRRVKELGFLLKLDTNGYFPARLRDALESGLCDYIAMDIKNSFEKYSQTAGTAGLETDRIAESIRLIRESGISHEFRTTVVKGMHTAEDIRRLTQHIKGTDRYFIQPFKESEGVRVKGLEGFNDDELSCLLTAARENVPKAEIRGA